MDLTVNNKLDAHVEYGLQVQFSSVLHKRLPAEAGISVVCVSPGIVDTNVVSISCPILVLKGQ